MNISKIKIGDCFISFRALHGEKRHILKKRADKNSGFDGWLVDDTGLMINPEHITKHLHMPFSTSVEGIRYKSDEELRNGLPKANKFNCPTCGSPKSSTVGFSPVQMSYDKYPKKDIDVSYRWEQHQKCDNCKTEFWYENGS